MSRGVWATALLLVSVGAASPAVAQTAPLAPVAPSASAHEPIPSILGAPIAVQDESVAPSAPPTTDTESLLPPPPNAKPRVSQRIDDPAPVTPTRPSVGVAGADGAVDAAVPRAPTPPPQPPGRSAKLGAPTNAAVIPAGSVETHSAPPSPAPDLVNDLLARRSTYTKDGPPGSNASSSEKIIDHLEGILGQRQEWFRSDHAFDGFISPVSNPFLFEDPRSLTEIRPIFIYQRVPGGQRDFFGGNISFFGTQARVAVTPRLSFTLNKLGGIWLNPNSPSPIDGDGGFAELWFGPKFTFIRSEETGSLLAGGLQFQVPVGSSSTFQNTGNLSLVPYVTYGQSFLRDCRFGSFNALVGTGYAFSVDKERSDYYYLSAHVDMNVLNWGIIYPVAELNWVLYTTNATSYPIGSEGRDLINFGGQAKGNNLFTGALGARLKITEAAQLGAVFEIPLAGNRDFFQYRFTVDFILRY